NAAGKFAVWAVDATGNYTSAVLTPTSGMSAALEALEPTFGQDLNLDGTVGVKTTLIQTDGSTSLTQVANNYYLFAQATTNGPKLTLSGAAILANNFGGWAPIGAVATQTGYDVAIQNGDEYQVWAFDSTGAYTSIVMPMSSGSSLSLEQIEPTFGQDL